MIVRDRVGPPNAKVLTAEFLEQQSFRLAFQNDQYRSYSLYPPAWETGSEKSA